MRKYLLSLLLLICFTACKEKEGEGPIPSYLNTCKPTKLIFTSSTSGVVQFTRETVYEYDNQDRLIKANTGLDDSVIYEYDTKNRLIKSTTTIPSNFIYSYYEYDLNDRCTKIIDTVTAINKFPNSRIDIYLRNFTYGPNGNRSRYDYKAPEGFSMPYGYLTYTYANGNLKEKYISSSNTTWIYEYYLDKENKGQLPQFYQFPFNDPYYIPTKNLLKSEKYMKDGIIHDVASYTYELNKQGYVLKKSRLASDGPYVNTWAYEYTCH